MNTVKIAKFNKGRSFSTKMKMSPSLVNKKKDFKRSANSIVNQMSDLTLRLRGAL